jgi:hypothetical protein
MQASTLESMNTSQSFINIGKGLDSDYRDSLLFIPPPPPQICGTMTNMLVVALLHVFQESVQTQSFIKVKFETSNFCDLFVSLKKCVPAWQKKYTDSNVRTLTTSMI